VYDTTQVHKVEWSNPELREYCFNFLFDKFKNFYLQEIFPDFKKLDIYEPDLGNVAHLFTYPFFILSTSSCSFTLLLLHLITVTTFALTVYHFLGLSFHD